MAPDRFLWVENPTASHTSYREVLDISEATPMSGANAQQIIRGATIEYPELVWAPIPVPSGSDVFIVGGTTKPKKKVN